MTRHVLHVAQPTEAGVARCVAQLAAHQVAAGWRVTVVAPPGGQLAAELTGTGVAQLAWPAQRSPARGVPGEVRRLRALLTKAAPDLVHLHSAKAGLDGRLALRGRTPTVFQPHAWSFDAATGPVRRASLAWERAASRWTGLLVCVSRAELEHGRRCGTAGGPSVVVPNGVDTDRVPAGGPAERAAARGRLGLGPGPLVVCVGRLARQKGQDVALAAWPQVRRAVPGAELVLVGDGPDEQALRAAAPDGVRFAGASSDPLDWYWAADVVAVPSRWEGMALTPLEAMSAGRAVVASDVTGIAESVPAGGGVVVPPEDPTALARALVARLDGTVDADAEGVVGRTHVQAHHAVAQSTSAITAAYAQVLGA